MNLITKDNKDINTKTFNYQFIERVNKGKPRLLKILAYYYNHLKENEPRREIKYCDVIEIDEMWHYVLKKQKSGYG